MTSCPGVPDDPAPANNSSLSLALSFACKIIPSGRPFLRRFIDLSISSSHLLHLHSSFRADIRWWLTFLPQWNGVAAIHQQDWVTSPDAQFWSDASGNLGFGAYFGGAWFSSPWPKDLIKEDIQFKEMYAIVAA